MIHATIRIATNPEQSEEAKAILNNAAARAQVVSGCITSRVYCDVQKGHVFTLDTVWEDEEGMHRHLGSEDFRNVLLVIEMAARQPEIRFEVISQVTGIETIANARNAI